MTGKSHTLRTVAIAAALLSVGAPAVRAQPSVVGTAQGQIGETPANPSFDRVFAPSFVPLSIPGSPLVEGDLFLARIVQPGGLMPPPTELIASEDRLHSMVFAAIEVDAVASAFANVDKVAPGAAPWPGEPTRGASSALLDGTDSGTAKLVILAFDFMGNTTVVTLDVDNIPTFNFPTEDFARTGVAVDDADFLTAVFTELPPMEAPKVRAARVDGQTGSLEDVFDVSLDGVAPEVAWLGRNPVTGDPAVVVVSLDATTPDAGLIQGNRVEFGSGGATVSPEFTISTTAGLQNFRPAVAADPVTGAFTVVWDHITGISGDPTDVRARRYDAAGNPQGDDFLVNVKPLVGDDNDQGQADVAYGPGGLSAVTWAAAGATSGGVDTDVFARAFLPDGTAITGGFPLTGGQFQVNTGATPGGPLTDRQDWPKVAFLPHPDAQGRPQFAVVWRDVGQATGAEPNGTGTTSRCFAIDGLEGTSLIFADGFESGDTSSWSSSTP